MLEETAMKFVDRFNSLFNEPNVDIVDEIFAPDFVGHLPLASSLDRNGWRDYVRSFYAAIPDLKETVNEVILSEDRVVIYVTYTGTHTGSLFGVSATGKAVTMEGIGLFRFNAQGLAVENRAVIDVAGLMAQIAGFPLTAPPAS